MLNIAKNMKKMGMTVDDIISATGLTAIQIASLVESQ